MGFVKVLFRVADGIGALCVGCREQVGGVDAAGQERLFIRQLGIPALFVHDLVDDLAYFFGKFVDAFVFFGGEQRLEVAEDLHFFAVPLEVVTGHELVHVLIEGLFADRVAVEQILLEHPQIDFLCKAVVVYDRVDVARAEHLAVDDGIKQLLLTDRITEDIELVRRIIIQRERERAVEVIYHLDAPFGKRLDQNALLAFFAGKRQSDPELLTQFFEVADVSAEILYLYHFQLSFQCRLLSKLYHCTKLSSIQDFFDKAFLGGYNDHKGVIGWNTENSKIKSLCGWIRTMRSSLL